MLFYLENRSAMHILITIFEVKEQSEATDASDLPNVPCDTRASLELVLLRRTPARSSRCRVCALQARYAKHISLVRVL